MKRTLTAVALCALTFGGLSVAPTAATAGPTESSRVVGGTPKAVNGARITRYFRGAVAALPVAAENRTGYAREKFVHWNDVDRDCQNTRAEVLKSESRIRTTGRCTISRGKWLSYYDQRIIYRATYLDIDHMIPLAESWDSGARAWSAARRQAFANDLTDRRSLVAVTASTNRSKSDRDPAEWLPQYKKCRYAFEWTIVKTRWSLRVDTAEKGSAARSGDSG